MGFQTILLLLICLTGLIMGSFLNCLAIRLLNGEPLVRGRSHCMSCKNVLGARDLVPLFSWLVQKGRCRYCGAKISVRYPISEAATALVFASLMIKYGLSWRLLELLLLSSVLLCISFCDLQEYIIPDKLIICGIICRMVFILGSGDVWQQMLQSLLGGLTAALPLLLIALAAEKIMKREAMGGGDIKLMFMIGLFFPWQIDMLVLLLGCLIGTVFGLFWSKGFGKEFPFGPSLAAGAWIAMLFGENLLNSYLGLF